MAGLRPLAVDREEPTLELEEFGVGASRFGGDRALLRDHVTTVVAVIGIEVHRVDSRGGCGDGEEADEREKEEFVRQCGFHGLSDDGVMKRVVARKWRD